MDDEVHYISDMFHYVKEFWFKLTFANIVSTLREKRGSDLSHFSILLFVLQKQLPALKI